MFGTLLNVTLLHVSPLSLLHDVAIFALRVRQSTCNLPSLCFRILKDGDGDIDVDDLHLLTREDVVKRVLKPHYWDRWKADLVISQSVANILVDWVWASGAHGIKIPQRLLGVTVDGIVGPKTLVAVNARNPRELFDMIKIVRFDFIEDICKKRPANNKFKRGWMNRINDLRFEE